MSLPRGDFTIRRSLCRRCPTPCGQQHNADFYGQPCNACPLPKKRWGRYGRCPAPQPAPTPESPGLLTKAARAAREVGGWIKAGALLAPREVRQARLVICQACPFYKANGNLGLGECRAPGCGCTRAKLALATARCPLNPPKWGPCKPDADVVHAAGIPPAK